MPSIRPCFSKSYSYFSTFQFSVSIMPSFRQLIHEFAFFEYLYYCNVSQDNRIKVGIMVTDNMRSNIKTLELERAWVVMFLFFRVSPLSVSSLSLSFSISLHIFLCLSLYICLCLPVFYGKLYEIFGWTEGLKNRCLVALLNNQMYTIQGCCSTRLEGEDPWLRW